MGRSHKDQRISIRNIIAAGLLFCALIPVSIYAEDAPSPADSVVTSNADNSVQIQLPLSKLIGDSTPVTLKGVSNQLGFSLPVPPLWHADQVNLVLRGTTSRDLIAQSQLVVSVNDVVVQQFPLKTENNAFEFNAQIPAAVLKGGFNRVSVAIAQHYSEVCEYPSAPQLWTQISLEESKFYIQASPKVIDANLGNLPALFSKANWFDKPTIPLITARAPNAEQISAMGLVAQGLGRRYDFVPIVIKQMGMPKTPDQLDTLIPANSRVGILMGTYQELGNVLDGLNVSTKDKSLIAIKTAAPGSDKYLVMLAANDSEGLKKIATAFALTGVPWPNKSWAKLDELNMPASYSLEKRFDIPVASTGAFPLRALDFKTTTFTGLDSEGASLRIWNNTWQGRMQVRVHLTYAGGMSTQSALNILSNGVMQGTIPLNNPQGGTYDNYAVTIPAGSLNTGWNTIQFKPVLIPLSNGGQCQPFFNGNLGVTVYEDTTLQKFGGDELKEPDLALLSGSGSIFTEGPLGQGIALQLTDASSDTLSSGLTLMAKLTEVFRRPLLNASFGVGEAEDMTHRYWVGPFDKLPKKVRESLITDFPSNMKISVPIIQSATFEVREGNEWFRNFLESLGIRRTPPAKFTSVDLSISGELNKHNFVASKSIDGDTTTVFTSPNSSSLIDGMSTLIDFGQWAQLKGSYAFWEPNSKQVHAITFDDTPYSAYGLRGGIGLWVSQYPWIALILLLLGIGFIIFLTKYVLERYRKNNHQDNEE